MTTATFAEPATPTAIRACEWVIGLNAAVSVALMAAPRLVRTPFDAAFFETPWPAALAAEPAQRAIDFYVVILGGVALGWMVALMGLVRSGVARGSVEAWRYAVAAVVLWFATDSAASIAVGNGVNVWLNVAFAAPLLGTLLWARPAR